MNANTTFALFSSWAGGSAWYGPRQNPVHPCRNPRCSTQTDHRGGYCSPACKQEHSKDVLWLIPRNRERLRSLLFPFTPPPWESEGVTCPDGEVCMDERDNLLRFLEERMRENLLPKIWNESLYGDLGIRERQKRELQYTRWREKTARELKRYGIEVKP